jgi:GT2 family glycosyltransferase
VRASVIVVSHRSHQWLVPCIESVIDQADEVILVDNGSPGASVSQVGARLGVRVRRLRANAGFSGGVNAGLAMAMGDVIGLLNDDAMAEPRWLELSACRLTDAAIAAVAPKLLLSGRFAEVRFPDDAYFAPGDGRPLGRQLFTATVDGADVLARLAGGVHGVEEGIVGGDPRRWRWTSGPDSIYVPLPPAGYVPLVEINGEAVPTGWTGQIINNAGSYLSVHGYGGDYGFETPDDGRFDEPAERFAATGAAMVVRAETFRSVGGMAPRFFAYYEDTDWCWRARLAGLTVRYEPAARVHHVRSVTSGGPWVPLVKLLAARNRLLCLARNAPMAFFRDELAQDWRRREIPGLRKSLVRHVPVALIERKRLARRWRVAPGEIVRRWAGADERW